LFRRAGKRAMAREGEAMRKKQRITNAAIVNGCSIIGLLNGTTRMTETEQTAQVNRCELM